MIDADRPAARLITWGGALFFAASLAYFVYAFAFDFEAASSAVAASAPTRVTWNVALFTIFALHHSVFARTRVRAWVARLCTPELERSVYVWLASALFLIVCAAWQPLPGTAWSASGYVRWLLRLVQLAGLGLMLRSALALDVFELAGVKEVTTAGASTAPTEFKTLGPYGWVRHPIYAGWLLFVFAATPMTFTRLAFAVISAAYLLIGIPLEERSMRRTPGGAYARYTAAVPWKLIPRIF